MASLIRVWYNFSGIQAGDRVAHVWGQYPPPGRQAPLDRFLQRVITLNTFRVSPGDMEAFARRILRFRPKVLIGYMSSLYDLARYLERSKTRLDLRAVISSAETLYPSMREYFSSVYECPVLNSYGGREQGAIAMECLHGTMHIPEETNLVEVVDGEVVVTNLDNLTMPLIRYRNEDLCGGIPCTVSCPCGRKLKALDGGITGRLSEIIVTPSGDRVHGELLSHVFYEVSGVRQFQAIQEDEKSLSIKVVAEAAFDRPRLEGHLGDLFPDMEIGIEQVREIEPGPSGKFKFILSRPGTAGGHGTGSTRDENGHTGPGSGGDTHG